MLVFNFMKEAASLYFTNRETETEAAYETCSSRTAS